MMSNVNVPFVIKKFDKDGDGELNDEEKRRTSRNGARKKEVMANSIRMGWEIK